jgi:hypothetical protein
MSLQTLQANIAILQSMLVDGAVIYRRERGTNDSWEQRDTVPDQPNFYRYEYKVELPSARAFSPSDVQSLLAIRDALTFAIEADSVSDVESVGANLQRFIEQYQQR